MAIAHQNYSTLSLMASLGLQVGRPLPPQTEPVSPEQLSSHSGCSLQQLAMCLTPAQKGHPLWQMIFREALQASPWAKPPPRNAHSSQLGVTSPDDGVSHRYTHLLHWLRDLAKPKKHARGSMQNLVEGCHSIVPIQLAAQGLTPRLPWTLLMHRLAGAHADLPKLAWMLKRKQNADLNIVVTGCPPTRMLMLVKQHRWSLPEHLLRDFTEAEIAAEQSGRLAILSVVQQQRTHLPEQTCFGSLPNEILSIIAQKAGYSLPSAPSAYGHAVGALQATIQLQICGVPITHACSSVLDGAISAQALNQASGACFFVIVCLSGNDIQTPLTSEVYRATITSNGTFCEGHRSEADWLMIS